MDIPDWLSFYLFLIEWARLYLVEWSSESMVGKSLLKIVLFSLGICWQMAVACSVIFFDGKIPCWNYSYEPYIQPGKSCPVNKWFPHYLCFTNLTRHFQSNPMREEFIGSFKFSVIAWQSVLYWQAMCADVLFPKAERLLITKT